MNLGLTQILFVIFLCFLLFGNVTNVTSNFKVLLEKFRDFLNINK